MPEKDVQISVITVCFNERERIEETLESTFSQSYKDFELILIDGQSTDGTVDVIKKYEGSIDKLVIEKDDGVYHAMNKGIDMASGVYVIFMNGGDKFYDQHVLERLASYATDTPDIIYGDLANVYPDGRVTTTHLPGSISQMFLTFNTICHQSLACKRDLLVELGGFDTAYRIAADYDFLVRAIVERRSTLVHLPTTVSYFFRDGLSHMPENKSLLLAERLSIQKKYLSGGYYMLSRVRSWAFNNRDNILLRPIRAIGNRLYWSLFKPREK